MMMKNIMIMTMVMMSTLVVEETQTRLSLKRSIMIITIDDANDHDSHGIGDRVKLL